MNTKFKFAFALVFVGALAACGPQKHDNNQNGQNPQAMNGAATGEQHPMGKRLLADCGQDLQQFCSGADKPRRCLRQNYDKVSSACKARLDLLKSRREERMQQRANGAQPAGSTAPKPQDDDDND